MQKYLGIDWGEKRIGLALGDNEIKMSTPFKVVSDLTQVVEVIKQEEIDEVIIGDPLGMDNNKGQMSDKVDSFVKGLKEQINIPIIKVDERLSSQGADALVGDKKTKASRDAMAAMLILQTYLDKI